MKFYTASATPRPVRLKAETRAWADESLHGRYGDEAVQNDCVRLDDIADFPRMTDLEKYDAAIARIAESAPLRICPQEKICGAATLGMAIRERVPVTFAGEPVFSSISHLTINYEKTLTGGIDSYAASVAERMAQGDLAPDQRQFLVSLQHVIAAMRCWHGRYLAATKETRPDLYQTLLQVPFGPARTFREAVQAIWFEFAFVRLCGNWPGIGLLDRLLEPYLQQDLQNGTLTLAEAREILASFFIKGCEWIQSDTPTGSGDAQHYQNIVLAGTDENGNEVAGAVTGLVLDIVEELAISDFPITVRIHAHTPEYLLRKVARVMRNGGGIVAIYNEDLVLRSLEKAGYAAAEAHGFANDGCWEVQIPGKTSFSYMPFDGLQILNRVLGVSTDGPIPEYADTEAIYQAFRGQLQECVETLYRGCLGDGCENSGGRWRRKTPPLPTSVVSLFEDGCIEHAASYLDFGPMYTVRSPHIGGAPDVANSLIAIENMVFREKMVTLPELVRILRKNWQGADALRLYAKNKLTYYGNDSPQADRYLARVLDDFADLVNDCQARHSDCPLRFIPGVSTFGRQIEWLPVRCAVAFGFRKGEILSGNDSPTPGTDSQGATAIIKSYCRADLEKQTCGAALDIRIFPDTLRGEDGLVALKALMRAFVSLNGYFMQLDTMDTATLLAAREHPEAYKTLSVRVSGWNARFVTLNREWQDMVIERTSQHV